MTSTLSQSFLPQNSMVSHPDIAGSTAPRPPPSISSRASTSNRRHHRHGRSHHGGSTYQPQNEFPFFAQTGDVEILISADGQEKRYLLHRLILAQNSGFFDAGTSEEWSRVGAEREAQGSSPAQDRALARIGDNTSTPRQPENPVTAASLSRIQTPRTRWRYELDWDNVDDDEEPMLVQKVGEVGNHDLEYMSNLLVATKFRIVVWRGLSSSDAASSTTIEAASFAFKWFLPFHGKSEPDTCVKYSSTTEQCRTPYERDPTRL